MSKETIKKTVNKAPVNELKNPLLDEEYDLEETSTIDNQVEKEVEAEEEVVIKKVATSPNPSVKKVVTPVKNSDQQLLTDIEMTKKTLESEEKIHFMIPLADGEKPGASHECFINGYKFSVTKGVMTMVPRSIAELLSSHYKVNLEAGYNFRIDLDSNKQDALS
jgi:hypothetical protein